MLGMNRLTSLIRPSLPGNPSGSESGKMTSEEKGIFREVMAHHLAEAKYQERLERSVAWAKDQGLPVEAVAMLQRPYPDRNTINITGMAGWLKGAIVALVTAGLGGASVLGLLKYLDKPSAVDKPPIERVIDNTIGKAVDFTTSAKDKDGNPITSEP